METFITGILIGLAVAAPVGPIGILCIRRTLTKGTLSGLATGLGAAFADATFGLIAAAGLAVTGLLVSYAGPLKIAGGILILLLGLASLRNFFSQHRDIEIAGDGRGLISAFASTYALTLSNPMTIVAFIGLIAGLATGSSSGAFYLVAGVLIGSALWWLILVSATLVVKTRIPPNVTRWLDLASGLMLIGWALWAFFGG